MENRNLEVRIRVTETEKALFSDLAGREGLSLSTWLRRLARNEVRRNAEKCHQPDPFDKEDNNR